MTHSAESRHSQAVLDRPADAPTITHCFYGAVVVDGRSPVPGDKALCGIVKQSTRNGEPPGSDRCVVCVSLLGGLA